SHRSLGSLACRGPRNSPRVEPVNLLKSHSRLVKAGDCRGGQGVAGLSAGDILSTEVISSRYSGETMTTGVTRRKALKLLGEAALGAPFVIKGYAAAPPSETLNHASFGAGGMAFSDIGSLTASKHVRLVAVADVDASRTDQVRKRFPNVRVYQDWRALLDQEKG